MEVVKAKIDEQELITACRQGKAWAQRKVYEQYAPSMMSVCFRYVNDRETARDLLQDGFIKVFSKIDSYSGSGAFGGWVRRIFVTTSLEYLRQHDALKQSDNLEEIGHSIENEDETALQKLSAADLMQCIGQLPEGYRVVFNMYAIEGYSHAEIADILQITEATSRSQLMRARKLLQKAVADLFHI